MVMTYLLYLRLSGQFHIAIGLIHLFGFDLPETHRKYLLASSVADFWRRINIYWKDFIAKLFYLPVFFRLRRSGEVGAAALATVVAFAATRRLPPGSGTGCSAPRSDLARHALLGDPRRHDGVRHRAGPAVAAGLRSVPGSATCSRWSGRSS